MIGDPGTTRLRDVGAAYDREVEHCRQGHASPHNLDSIVKITRVQGI